MHRIQGDTSRAPRSAAEPQRDVWRGRVRRYLPHRLPMKKDSASPTGQGPLLPPLEPETKKPKIGWKNENVSRSTVPVRLLDFRGHREVRRSLLQFEGHRDTGANCKFAQGHAVDDFP